MSTSGDLNLLKVTRWALTSSSPVPAFLPLSTVCSVSYLKVIDLEREVGKQRGMKQFWGLHLWEQNPICPKQWAYLFLVFFFFFLKHSYWKTSAVHCIFLSLFHNLLTFPGHSFAYIFIIYSHSTFPSTVLESEITQSYNFIKCFPISFICIYIRILFLTSFSTWQGLNRHSKVYGY